MLPRRGLELLANVLITSLAISGQLDGVELDLGGDDAVGLRVVIFGVQTEEGREAEVIHVLERIAKSTPGLRERKK